MQAPCEPASHESKADESNLGVEFIEFCYWHVNDVSSLRPAVVSFLSAIDPNYDAARILPLKSNSDRFRISQIQCFAHWMIRLLSKLRHSMTNSRHERGCPYVNGLENGD